MASTMVQKSTLFNPQDGVGKPRTNFPLLSAIKISCGLVLALSSSILLENKALGYNFRYSATETEIFNTDFNASNGWILSGTTIAGGEIKGVSQWGGASYSLDIPVNLERGEVFIYWSGIFPATVSRPGLSPLVAHQENDRYFIGLEYADNPAVAVCVNANGVAVAYPPCTGATTLGTAQENAELKVALRPPQINNSGNTYHQVYIDPDFDLADNFTPVFSTTTPNNSALYRVGTAIDFRLGIKKVTADRYEVSFQYWNSTDWLPIEARGRDSIPTLLRPKSTYYSLLPLQIQQSDWIDDRRKTQSPAPYLDPVVFKAIKIQFRKNSPLDSTITALALTQTTSVPEGSSAIAILSVFGFGFLCGRQSARY
jgi:hypothetical protein